MKKLIKHIQEEWYKYFLEILVLIIGIYGAFAVERWNEDRKDKIREQKVLTRLLEDFESDLIQLDSRIRLRNLIISYAQQAVLYIDNPQNIPMDSVYIKVSPLFYTTTFDPIDHKLMESGDIHLIENEKLKHLLSTWPSYLHQLKEVEYEYINTYRNIILPFFIETGVGRGMDYSIWTDETFYDEQYWIGQVTTNDNIVKKPTRSIDAQAFLKNPKLESILTNAITINTVCQIESDAIRNRIEMIIELITNEIE